MDTLEYVQRDKDLQIVDKIGLGVFVFGIGLYLYMLRLLSMFILD